MTAPAFPFSSGRRPPLAVTAVVAASLLLALALRGVWRHDAPGALPAITLPPARPLPSEAKAEMGAIAFLQKRVQSDPDNTIAQNQLCGYLLQRLRETGDHRFLTPARRAAKASLHAVSEEQNTGALSALARVELAAHEFGAASVHARRLIALEPTKSGPHALLGDALQELGDYPGATREFARARLLGADGVESETRQARLDVLNGHPDAAQTHFVRALALALDWPVPPRETITWCYWQMGETAFSTGDLGGAERFYRDALTVSSEDFRARSGLVRVLAARGDWNGALAQFDQSVLVTPDTAFLGTLGDIYHLAGREREARGVYTLLELTSSPAKAKTPLARLHARLHARQLALFYADHNLHLPDAYALALRDYATRRDIYGADALAWTAFKAGHLAQAQAAIRAALRLHTQDARFFYHAGMIERALGHRADAKEFLRRALDLNSGFDPLQAPLCRRSLASLL